jgi:beta-hydroxylase
MAAGCDDTDRDRASTLTCVARPLGAGAARRRLEAGVERGLSALLQLDQRMIERASGPSVGALDPDEPAWAAEIRAAWPDIRAELDSLLADGVLLPETSDLVGADQGAEGRWTTYVLGWYGTWIESTCRRCPRTAALVRRVPGVQVAGFTVLDAHTHLPRHQGPAKSLRWQLGIRIPEPPGSCRLRIGDDVVVWGDGVALAFDDRTEHEAWNDSDEPRYVLFIQVPWPVRGWPGVVHRVAHRTFATATRRIPRRAAELDEELNRR